MLPQSDLLLRANMQTAKQLIMALFFWAMDHIPFHDTVLYIGLRKSFWWRGADEEAQWMWTQQWSLCFV